ncbi:MAG: M36 family metallopeptidase [Acidobacteria bacterium]|nr:M36 family metallopeptidase [Acidobacteriota bacterium]
MFRNGKFNGESLNATCVCAITMAFVVMLFLAPVSVVAQLNLWDAPQGLPDLDNRAGRLTPTAEQLALVNSLGAKAEWNKFGTVQTMLKYGGFLATGLSGDPVSAAREWIRANRALFRLSDQSVTNLELVSDGTTPHSSAHAVLFRQRFGNLVPTQDGLINVAIVNGKVYHVWSSSAGDQAAPGAATLTPTDAWIKAAASVNHFVPVGNVLSAVVDKQKNWTVLKVVGFPQDQQVRLTALPTPTSGVRPAYEANVVYVQGHITDAYTIFVDAQTGDILYRVNRVNWAAAVAPDTQVFTGTYQDAPLPPVCGPKHPFTLTSNKLRVAASASAAVPSNDIILILFEVVAGIDVERARSDTATSPEAVNYEPGGTIPAGTVFKVQVCPFTPPSAPAVPPYNYAGTFTADDSPLPGAELPSPKWKYFLANPLLDYSSTDVRKIGCWSLDGTLDADCNRDERNTASRFPWDYDTRANNFTNTTRGNNAQAAESWGSPLTPSTPYSPEPASPRQYIFPWFNEWKTANANGTPIPGTTGKGCLPALEHGGHDADIDAAITHLFVTHNRMHDWSYFLGFTELNSNMQLNNFGNTQPSRENDPEVGNVQAGAISGGAPSYLGRDNANQITLQDGTPGITNQYLFQPIAAALYSPCVDGDMDVGIVAHEYTHAISNRMVAGPDAGLSDGSMGESWSDLNAAEYLWENGFVPTADEDPTAVGIYATQNKKVAIRNFSMSPNPLNFGNVGYDTGGVEVHSDGEIWNAVNWEVRQALVDKYNAQYPYTDTARQKACAEGKFNPENCPGNRRWMQLVYDSWLLQGATNMLIARDAMLAADVARFGGANQTEIWRAFAKRGFGVDAIVTSGDVGIPNFDSPVETNEATITFQAVAQDENNAPVTNAKIIVGQFQARSRAIADTDPATVVDNSTTTTRRQTLNKSDTAKFVPGTYDLIVQAPGYGIQRFSRTFTANQTATVVFSLATNIASSSKGATATTSSGLTPNNLIDDTEDTGAQFGNAGPVAGKSITVNLAGTAPMLVTSVNVSAAAGPAPNNGRFNALRKFEIRTCVASGLVTCATDVDFTNVAFTSANDAFPGDVPRPLQPNLNVRSFTLPTPTSATHVQLRALTNQCLGQPKFLGDQDDDPSNNSDCATSASATQVRAAEFEVFGSCNRVNMAASAAGATASASSTFVGTRSYPASTAIDGERTGKFWESGGGWNDGTRGVYPDSLGVNFSGAKTINEIRVYTLQNDYGSGQEPTPTTPATSYGILDFEVQTCTGVCTVSDDANWVTVSGGSVTNNDKALRIFTFPDITTAMIRVKVNNSRSYYSRIVEVEAFGCQ